MEYVVVVRISALGKQRCRRKSNYGEDENSNKPEAHGSPVILHIF
jgi:hypothetical protein